MVNFRLLSAYRDNLDDPMLLLSARLGQNPFEPASAGHLRRRTESGNDQSETN